MVSANTHAASEGLSVVCATSLESGHWSSRPAWSHKCSIQTNGHASCVAMRAARAFPKRAKVTNSLAHKNMTRNVQALPGTARMYTFHLTASPSSAINSSTFRTLVGPFNASPSLERCSQAKSREASMLAVLSDLK